MKNKKLLLVAILGSILMLVMTGCGPTGGTITVVNESSIALTNVTISLGKSQVNQLNPGEWMKASVDKNTLLANVTFDAGVVDIINPSPYGKDAVQVPGYEGTWIFASYTSPGIGVNNGESIIVTVKNK
jgi:hypothetical protein